MSLFKATLNRFPRRGRRGGMRCEAPAAAFAPATAKIDNAADQPQRGCATRERPVERCPHRRTLLTAGAAALLTGCGFQLRRAPALAFRAIALTGFAPRSALAEELKRQLVQQVRVVDAPAQADVVLHAIDDRRERSVVASTSAAQVRELQLRLKFNFRAHTPGGRELIPRVELLLTRDLNYSETFALAKEQEDAELFRDMQSDVVAQVLRRLATVVV